MDNLITLTDLKSTVTFLHLSGLALGIGGAWILDLFVIKHLVNNRITEDRFYCIQFVSKLVLTGLAILWISGLFFIMYYYFFTPEFLLNDKVWAKMMIVVILSTNGYFVHRWLIPNIKRCVGKTILEGISSRDTHIMVSIGVISFFSWLFPIVLGVLKSVNFSTSISDIIGVYLIVIFCSLTLVNLILLPVRSRLIQLN